MSIADKLVTIAENQEKVYNSGGLSQCPKNTVSGEVVAITDISPIEHSLSIKLSNSSAILKVQGKNLFNNDTSLIKKVEYASSSGVSGSRYGYEIALPVGTYTIKPYDKRLPDDTYPYYIYGVILNKDNIAISAGLNTIVNNSFRTVTFTIKNGETFFIYDGETGNLSGAKNKFSQFDFQLEVGESATEYEEYKEPTYYTPNADGTVEGVKSIYPNMTLMADTSGVLIECEYHQNPQKVGEAIGKQAEYDAFWDSFQNYGNRTNYNYCFASECWNDKTFKPKYDINIKGYCPYFGTDTAVTDMSKILSDCGVVLNTANATDLSYMFYMADVTKLPALDLSKATNLSYCVYSCSSLKEIEKVIVTEKQTFPNSFLRSASLERVIFEGTIASTITLTGCKLLSKESVESIISCLSETATGKTLTLSLTAVNNAFETSSGAADGSTSEEWINLITPKSNSYNGLWTITLA